MNCQDAEKRFTLYLYRELSDRDRSDLEAHLSGCASCRKSVEQLGQLHRLLSERKMEDASPELLAWCRQALDQAIEREAAQISWRSLWQSLRSSWSLIPASRGAWALAIVALGFGMGWTLRPIVHRMTKPIAAVAPAQESALGSFHVAEIKDVTPDSATGGVKIAVDAQKDVTLSGSLADPRIRSLLVNAMKGYSNPGIRFETLNALSAGSNDPSIRAALLYALERDPNAGVRLKALQAVQQMDWTPEVERAVLHALTNDQNSGVRVAAVNLLAKHAGPAVLPQLRQLASDDSNPYVRLICARTVRRAEMHGR